MTLKTELLDEKAISRCLTRVAHEILEKNQGADDIILLGIITRGYPLAFRIAKKIEEIEGKKVKVTGINITEFRDDARQSENPKINKEVENIELEDKVVVLVDDVLYTGRTVRAAMDAVVSVARPRSIQLACLVDRGHRELPIRADYVGKNVPTSSKEKVAVKLTEVDGMDLVSLYE